MVADYHHKVNFLFVYILEAHAEDEWPIKELQVEIKQHKCVADRLEAARNFIGEYDLHHCMKIAVDNEDNAFVEQYASWPFRYWGFQQGRIVVKAMPDGDAVVMEPLMKWLYNLPST